MSKYRTRERKMKKGVVCNIPTRTALLTFLVSSLTLEIKGLLALLSAYPIRPDEREGEKVRGREREGDG